jgi:hypothetical protein
VLPVGFVAANKRRLLAKLPVGFDAARHHVLSKQPNNEQRGMLRGGHDAETERRLRLLQRGYAGERRLLPGGSGNIERPNLLQSRLDTGAVAEQRVLSARFAVQCRTRRVYDLPVR